MPTASPPKPRSKDVAVAECDLPGFREAFAVAAKAAAGSAVNPVLQSVLIECGPDGGSMVATDNEVGVRVEVPGLACPAPFSALVPASRMGAILGSVSREKGTITLAPDGSTLRVRLGAADQWSVSTQDASAHPGLADADGGPVVELDCEGLARAIRRTIHSCNPTIAIWALGGVNLSWGPGVPELVATAADGKRVACQREPALVPDEGPDPRGNVVPIRLARMFLDAAKAGGPCRLRFPGRTARLEAGGVTLVGTLQQGEFPRWDRVLSRPTTHVFRLDADELRARIVRAAAAASESTRTLDLRFDGPELVVSSPASESGSGRSSMAIEPSGGPIAITVVAGNLLDVLATLEGERVELDLGGDKASAILRADGLTYPFALYDREKQS